MNDVHSSNLAPQLFAIMQPPWPCHVISLLGMGSISFGMLCLCGSRQASSLLSCPLGRLERRLLFSSLTSSLNGKEEEATAAPILSGHKVHSIQVQMQHALCTIQVALLFIMLAIAFFGVTTK